jgi:hypothetical protein
MGFGPTASVRWRDRWILGASLSFINAQMFGVYVGYEINSDWRDQDAQEREDSVSLVEAESKSFKFDPNSGIVKVEKQEDVP